jgi:hypothetical protein
VIIQRTLAVISAALLVSAVAIATFGPHSISLGQALFLMDRGILDNVVNWSNHALGGWVWSGIVQPLLVRPAWLLPATIGIICSGLSLSLSTRKSTHRSHRRS